MSAFWRVAASAMASRDCRRMPSTFSYSSITDSLVATISCSRGASAPPSGSEIQ